MSKGTVLIATKSPFSADARNAAVEIVKSNGLTAKVLENYSSIDEYIGALREADAAIIRSDPFAREEIDILKDEAPRLIVRAGAGYDNIDHNYAEVNHIVVENTDGQNSNAVAEIVMSSIGMMIRNLHLADESTKQEKFEKKKYIGSEFKGKNMSVIGSGAIGRLVIRKAHGNDLGSIVAFDPKLSEAKKEELIRDYGVRWAESLEEAVDDAHFITLHTPENDHTRGMCDSDLLSKMRDDVILVNTARSGLIVYDHLEAIMNTRESMRYIADVHPEGDNSGMKRMARFGNRVLLFPHIGASTPESNFNCATQAARQCVDFLTEGRVYGNVNNPLPAELRDYTILAEMLGKVNRAFIQGTRKVTITCYGELEKHEEQFMNYVLKGAYQDFLGRDMTPQEALKQAETEDIELNYSKPDPKKGHGNAIWVRYTDGNQQNHSLRGRLDEGEPQLNKLDDFKVTVPLEQGVYIVAKYYDRAGMADTIGSFFTGAGFDKPQGVFRPHNGKAIACFQIGAENGEAFKRIQTIVERDISNIDGVYQTAVFDLR